MKLYLSAAALVLASTTALADRYVMGTNGHYDPYSAYYNKGSACLAAKADVKENMVKSDEKIESWDSCDCERSERIHVNHGWACIVGANLVDR